MTINSLLLLSSLINSNLAESKILRHETKLYPYVKPGPKWNSIQWRRFYKSLFTVHAHITHTHILGFWPKSRGLEGCVFRFRACMLKVTENANEWHHRLIPYCTSKLRLFHAAPIKINKANQTKLNFGRCFIFIQEVTFVGIKWQLSKCSRSSWCESASKLIHLLLAYVHHDSYSFPVSSDIYSWFQLWQYWERSYV